MELCDIFIALWFWAIHGLFIESDKCNISSLPITLERPLHPTPPPSSDRPLSSKVISPHQELFYSLQTGRLACEAFQLYCGFCVGETIIQ